jgi:hypothetical protein
MGCSPEGSCVKSRDAGANVTTYTTNQKTAKKPYNESPRLVIYGDVREITQALSNAGGGDGQSVGDHLTK